ncbi:MAG: hypothetical protein AABW59_03890 [archaeon]
MDNFFKGFVFGVIFLALALSQPGFAYAAENPNGAFSLFFADTNPLVGTDTTSTATVTTKDTNPKTTTDTPAPSLYDKPPAANTSTPSTVQPKTSSKEGSPCSVSKLSPQEAKNVMNLTSEGFDGKSMSDGKDTNVPNPGRNLDGTELNAKDNASNKAIKVTPPTQAGFADRFGFLSGTKISGPFGIGLVMDDTLRVGKCQLSPEQCRINELGLTYRTSGTGIVTDLKNALASGKEELTKGAIGLTDAQYEAVRNNVFDDNQDYFTAAKNTPNPDTIKNSILTNSYTARQATTCNNNQCIISTYSAFDKYYNAWFSSNMVLTNVAPMFVHSAAKMMGILGRRSVDGTVFNKLNKLFESKRQSIVGIPVEALGQSRAARYNANLKKYGMDNLMKDLTIGKKLFSSGAGGVTGNLLDPNGPVMKLSKEDKGHFFDIVDDLRAYTRTMKAQGDAYTEAYNDAVQAATGLGGIVNAAGVNAAKVQYGRDMSKLYINWDDVIPLDYLEWLKDNDVLTGFKGIAVKRNGMPADAGFVELSTSPPFNFKEILKKFSNKGDWSDWSRGAGSMDAYAFESSAAGNLKLYELSQSKILQSNVDVSELAKHVSQYGEGKLGVKLPTGEILPLDSASIKMIETNPTMPGHVDILQTQWTPKVYDLTPEDMANRVTQGRIVNRQKTAEFNLDELYYGLKEKGFSTRKEFGLLDSQFAKETDMLKDYYKKPLTAGIYTGTLLPIAFWNFKKGFGNEEFSAYMLPDSWSTLEMSQGFDDVYKDAYTDFFANEGSDQGDLFARMLNWPVFAWRFVGDEIASKNPTMNDYYTRITGGEAGMQSGLFGKTIMRDTVGDVAFYSHNETCSDCTAILASEGDYFKLANFTSSVAMQTFLVEAADAETVEKNGATLIAFAHHNDLKGKTGDVEGDKVSLATARKDGTTCDQKLRDLGLGWAGKGVGGLFSTVESIGYMVGIGPGILASTIQQAILAPELQDCVDDVEGYYVHFYAPPAVAAKKASSKEVLSSESVSTAVSDMSSKVSELVQNKESPVAQSLDKIKTQFDSFKKQVDNTKILQANVVLTPPSFGNVMGKEVFYVWYKGQTMPAEYKTEGKLITKDGNTTIEVNYETGQLLKNGKVIIDSNKADHVRLITPVDTRIPAQVVPMTINRIGSPDTNDTVFELNAYGEVKIKQSEVLACIRQAVKDQTGIEFNGDDLTQAFGALTGINTKLYSNVFAKDGKIYLEGGTRTQGGVNSKFIIDGYWQTRFDADVNKGLDTGKFIGMTFAHGTIVLKEETNELIVWLRQHKDSVLSNKEVAGLNAKLTKVADPETGCEQPAITLEAKAFPNDELGQQKVGNFNTSMNHLGPFTQFVTDDKIYEFYSKRDGNTGACKEFFKVIDKKTGKVLEDSEIVGGVKQLEDGTIQFKTADGKDHSLKFDAENGVPKLSYNGGPPETLRSAQGPNGSFWYDPETGLWYPENGLQIPMNESFKDNGAYFGADKNGNVAGVAGNPMTLNVGSQGSGGFNIPSLPETTAGLVLFIALFLAVVFFATGRIENMRSVRKRK